jgi:hypothetical protein
MGITVSGGVTSGLWGDLPWETQVVPIVMRPSATQRMFSNLETPCTMAQKRNVR